MKQKIIGVAVGLTLLGSVLGWADGYPAFSPSTAEPPAAAGAANDLIALSHPAEGHFQQVTVIDSKRRVMGVYHIDLRTGQIELKGVRDFSWDLKMEEFNGGSGPAPSEIRAMFAAP
ncbi:MAG TPA: hypothetical protein ENJ16_01090 [Planctomycetaceae bacterium]|nr:hypothetical protein [Planctomycetaceae bacterium]